MDKADKMYTTYQRLIFLHKRRICIALAKASKPLTIERYNSERLFTQTLLETCPTVLTDKELQDYIRISKISIEKRKKFKIDNSLIIYKSIKYSLSEELEKRRLHK